MNYIFQIFEFFGPPLILSGSLTLMTILTAIPNITPKSINPDLCHLSRLSILLKRVFSNRIFDRPQEFIAGFFNNMQKCHLLNKVQKIRPCGFLTYFNVGRKRTLNYLKPKALTFLFLHQKIGQKATPLKAIKKLDHL